MNPQEILKELIKESNLQRSCSGRMSQKTVCIVGAGQSGLISVRECVVKGLKTTCYELEPDIGGLWRPRDRKANSNGVALWPNFITNTSKWANCFSDYPPDPKDSPYQDREALFQYFNRYCKHFGLQRYIKFNTRVIWIRKSPDHEVTGRWEVFTCPTSDFRGGDKRSLTPETQLGVKEREELLSKCKKETFDCIIICSGYFKYPLYPKIPGISTFKGTIHHAFNYSDPKDFEGKTVLLVGNKLSATDVCDDVAFGAKQVYLSVGEGTWIIPRVYPGGCTHDQLITRHLIYHPNYKRIMNEWVVTTAQSRLDHKALGMAPPVEPALAPEGYGDGLAVKIMSGRVKVYGRVCRLTGNEAHFTDGNVIAGLDAVLFCTGYAPDFSFLETEIVAPSGRIELYKMTFPLNQAQNSLAIVGALGADVGYVVLSELQARLATYVMTGQFSLPSQEAMKKDADHWNQLNWKVKKNYNYFIPGYPLMESIATDIGVYPSFWKILLRDPLLAYRVWYGNFVGAQYRLLGPDNQWEQARQFCHQQYEERAKCLRNIGVLDHPTSPEIKKSGRRVQLLIVISIGAVSCGIAIALSRVRFSPLF